MSAEPGYSFSAWTLSDRCTRSIDNTARGNVFLGSTTTINLDQISSGGVVRVEGPNSINNVGSGSAVNVSGFGAILEAANGGIGM